LLEIALASAVGLPLFALSAWRPAAGCAVLALLVPLTGGIGRGTVVPVLRPSEALAMVVLTGLLYNIAVRRRRLAFVGLDLVVLIFVLVEVLIPLLTILLRPGHVDTDTWMTVLAPIQYLAVYVLFSRCEPGAAGLRWIINMAFVASIVVAAVAVLEAFSPSFHAVVSTYYEESVTPTWDPVYRPSSLVTHYAAVAGFGFLSGSLAAALLVGRHPAFRAPWLGLVIVANACGLLVSQTWAPLVALPIVAGAIVLCASRIPWRQLVVAAGLAALGRAGWRARASPDPSARTLGAACLGAVLALAITGFTSEYLTFSALTQLFWMLVGLLVAVRPEAPVAGDEVEARWSEPLLARLREAPAGGA